MVQQCVQGGTTGTTGATPVQHRWHQLFLAIIFDCLAIEFQFGIQSVFLNSGRFQLLFGTYLSWLHGLMELDEAPILFRHAFTFLLIDFSSPQVLVELGPKYDEDKIS